MGSLRPDSLLKPLKPYLYPIPAGGVRKEASVELATWTFVGSGIYPSLSNQFPPLWIC